MQHTSSIQGVIFDLDGTLVESSLDFDLMRSAIGCPRDTGILEYIDTLEDPVARLEATRKIEQIELEEAARSAWMPGARQLVETLNTRGYPLAILTRNFSAAAAIKIRNNQIPIELVLTREHHTPKPDPAGLNAIARRWRIPTQQLVYVGDFLYDIEAARNGGLLSCLYAPDEPPDYADQADFLCRNFDQFLALTGLDKSH